MQMVSKFFISILFLGFEQQIICSKPSAHSVNNSTSSNYSFILIPFLTVATCVSLWELYMQQGEIKRLQRRMNALEEQQGSSKNFAKRYSGQDLLPNGCEPLVASHYFEMKSQVDFLVKKISKLAIDIDNILILENQKFHLEKTCREIMVQELNRRGLHSRDHD